MGVRLRSRNQTAKWGMVHEKFSSSEKSTHEQIQGENHDYCFFFDNRGIVHKEFMPPAQAVNHAFYKDVLERLRKRFQRVRRDIADDWVLQHDNAPAHTALSIREFLAKKNIPVHPSSLRPRSSSVRFLPLPKVEIEIEGSSFRDDGKHRKICNRWAKHTYGKWLPVLLDQWKKTLEPLCNFPRVVLWRR